VELAQPRASRTSRNGILRDERLEHFGLGMSWGELNLEGRVFASKPRLAPLPFLASVCFSVFVVFRLAIVPQYLSLLGRQFCDDFSAVAPRHGLNLIVAKGVKYAP
jgi:hypothetical protein